MIKNWFDIGKEVCEKEGSTKADKKIKKEYDNFIFKYDKYNFNDISFEDIYSDNLDFNGDGVCFLCCNYLFETKSIDELSKIITDLDYRKEISKDILINMKNYYYKKFGYDEEFNISDIKDDNDVLKYMERNIKYGWYDKDNNLHFDNMKDFRREYISSSIPDVIDNKMGTCIEQCYLMKELLDGLGYETHMYCTRVYENDDYDNLDESEHMHCFLLYNKGGEIYNIEHANWCKTGITKYNSIDEAITDINKYYEGLCNGKVRDVTEFNKVESGLTFKEFNNYINSIDRSKNK